MEIVKCTRAKTGSSHQQDQIHMTLHRIIEMWHLDTWHLDILCNIDSRIGLHQEQQSFPLSQAQTVTVRLRYKWLKMARNNRNPKRNAIRSSKKFPKLQRRHKSQSGDGEESVARVMGWTMLYFIRSMASRGLVFFFFCILISLYNIYRK